MKINRKSLHTTADRVDILTDGGSPTMDTVEEFMNSTDSSGFFDGGILSDAGSGNVNISEGSGMIRTTTTETDPLLSFKFGPFTDIVVATDTTKYVYVDYNSGSPIQVLSDSEFDETTTKILIGVATNELGAIESTFNLGVRLQESIGQAGRFIRRVFGISRDERRGGLIFGETGTRNLTMSAGHLWWGRTDYTITGRAGGESFDIYYRDSPSGWVKGSTTQWPNTQYDDGSGILATLGSNKWATLWIYLEPDDHVVMVYGRAQFNTQATAEEEAEPNTLPPRLQNTAVLAARIVFLTTAATADFTSAFVTIFNKVGVTSHGDLSNLLDDNHTQYLLVDGTRAMSGGLDMGTNAITNVTSIATDTLTSASAGGITVGDDVDLGSNKLSFKNGETLIYQSGGATTFEFNSNFDFLDQGIPGNGFSFTENVFFPRLTGIDFGLPSLPWDTAYINTIDLGTNTITDGSMVGDWNFGTGNLTTTGTITANDFDATQGIVVNSSKADIFGIDLNGFGSAGTAMGGFIHLHGAATGADMFVFANGQTKFVVSDAAQSSAADDGIFSVSSTQMTVKSTLKVNSTGAGDNGLECFGNNEAGAAKRGGYIALDLDLGNPDFYMFINSDNKLVFDNTKQAVSTETGLTNIELSTGNWDFVSGDLTTTGQIATDTLTSASAGGITVGDDVDMVSNITTYGLNTVGKAAFGDSLILLGGDAGFGGNVTLAVGDGTQQISLAEDFGVNASPNNTLDLGSANAGKFRDFFLGRDATIDGDVIIGGTGTFAGDVLLTDAGATAKKLTIRGKGGAPPDRRSGSLILNFGNVTPDVHTYINSSGDIGFSSTAQTSATDAGVASINSVTGAASFATTSFTIDASGNLTTTGRGTFDNVVISTADSTSGDAGIAFNLVGGAGEGGINGANFDGSDIFITSGDGGDGAGPGSIGGDSGTIHLGVGERGAGSFIVGNYGDLLLQELGGNVGLGTLTPTAKFHLVGDDGVTGALDAPDFFTLVGGTGAASVTGGDGADYSLTGGLGGVSAGANPGGEGGDGSLLGGKGGAAAIGTGGTGGDIFIASGEAGAGLVAGVRGKVFIQKDGGDIDMLDGSGNIVTVAGDLTTTGNIKGNFQSSDGSQGITQTETTVNTFDITIKDGLITSFTKLS